MRVSLFLHTHTRPPHFKVFKVCTEILRTYIKEYVRFWAHVEAMFLNIYQSGNISTINCRKNIHLMPKQLFRSSSALKDN
jgi:hypothetical protein